MNLVLNERGNTNALIATSAATTIAAKATVRCLICASPSSDPTLHRRSRRLNTA